MRGERVAFTEILALALGELDGPRAARCEALLGADPESLETLNRVRSALQVMRSDDSVMPPAAIVARVKQIFAASLPVRPTWLDTLQQWVAGILYDSRRAPALAGFRAAQESVQLTYAVDADEIDLQLEPPSEGETRWTIFGQLPQRASNQAETCLMNSGGDLIATTRADEHGVFRFKAAPGNYSLAIRWESERAVRLEDLECK